MKIALDIQSLSFVQKEITLLDNISFSVGEQEKFAILGPNGAGKSLLIDCILGNLDFEKGGKVTCFGQQKIKHNKHRIGVLYEVFSSFPYLKIKEIIDLMHSIYTVPKKDSYALDIHRSLKLEDLEDKFFGVMSKGERQRVGIYFALFHQPDLVFFDEPTGGLDPLMRDAFWKLVARTTSTIVYISHMWNEVQHQADKVVFLNQGRLLIEPLPPKVILENHLPCRKKIVVEHRPALLDEIAPHHQYLMHGEDLAILFDSDKEKKAILSTLGRFTNNYSIFDVGLKDAFQYINQGSNNKRKKHEYNSLYQVV